MLFCWLALRFLLSSFYCCHFYLLHIISDFMFYSSILVCFMDSYFKEICVYLCYLFVYAHLNSLAPERPGCHFKTAIFTLVLLIGIFTSSKGDALRWMPRDLNDEKSTLVQVMASCRQATSHYLSQCWPSSMSPYGVARPQRVNSLWSSVVLWRQKSGSTLAQVMAFCLAAPSRYLNQCWLTISGVLWLAPESNFIGSSQKFNL